MHCDVLLANFLESGGLEHEAGGDEVVREVDRERDGGEDEEQETAHGGHCEVSSAVVVEEATIEIESSKWDEEQRKDEVRRVVKLARRV